MTAQNYGGYIRPGESMTTSPGAPGGPQGNEDGTWHVSGCQHGTSAPAGILERNTAVCQNDAQAVRLTLPWPPSGNKLWRHLKNRAKPVLSREGRTYYATVASIVALARAQKKIPRRALTGRCIVLMRLTPPDRRKRDAGNVEKTLYDALTRANVWLDDVQGNDLSREWAEPKSPGKIEIVIVSGQR